MIPNKIYLAFKGGFVAQAANVPEVILDEYNPVEFVNKKALLKWAKKHQCEQGFEDGEAEHGYQSAIRDLIKHIESL